MELAYHYNAAAQVNNIALYLEGLLLLVLSLTIILFM